MEDHETDPHETLMREIQEEIRIDPNFIDDITLRSTDTDDTRTFHIFTGFVDREFDIPNIKKDENDDYGWFDEENLPNPMHKRWSKTFQVIKPVLDLRESFKKSFNKMLYG